MNEEQIRFVVDTTYLILGSMTKLVKKHDTTAIIRVIKELKFVSILLASANAKCLTSSQETETFIFQVVCRFGPNFFLALWLLKLIRSTVGAVY